jgi:hypothetical protein
MWEQIDARMASAAQGAGRRVVRDEVPARAPPAPPGDETQAGRPGDRLDRVEWGNEPPDAAIGRPGIEGAHAGKREDLTRLVHPHVDDAPAPTPNENEIPGPHLAGWR